MSNKISILLLLLVLAVRLSAQDINAQVQKSDLFADDYKNATLLFTESDGHGGVLVIRLIQGGLLNFPKSYVLEHYDNNLKLLNKHEFLVEMSKVQGLFVADGNVTVIELSYDKKSKKAVYVANTSKLDDFNFTRTELFSEEMKMITFVLASNGVNPLNEHYKPIFILSEDHSSFALVHRLQDKSHYKLYVYGSDLKQKFVQDLKHDRNDQYFAFGNMVLSNDGKNLYVLSKVFSDLDKERGGKYQYEISKVTADGIESGTFETDEHYIQSLKAVIHNDKLICTGFYSDKRDYQYSGICYVEIDPNSLAVAKKNFNPFTAQFMMDKYGSEKQKDLKFLVFRSLHFTAANEIIFNAEEVYYVVVMKTGPLGMEDEKRMYHYDDIVTVKLSSEGEMAWARNINKRQSTTDFNNNYLSYTAAVKDATTYFAINTDDKVRKLRNDRIEFRQASKSNSNLNLIKIDTNGNMDFQEILSADENEVPFMTGRGGFSNGSIFLLGGRRKDKQLLKLSF